MRQGLAAVGWHRAVSGDVWMGAVRRGHVNAINGGDISEASADAEGGVLRRRRWFKLACSSR